MSPKEYIGDGVYISNDGWHIVLETERENGTNIVYLEPELVSEVVRYGVKVKLISGEYLAKRVSDE